MEELETQDREDVQLMDPRVWRSFAATFAQKWKEAVRAYQVRLERRSR